MREVPDKDKCSARSTELLQSHYEQLKALTMYIKYVSRVLQFINYLQQIDTVTEFTSHNVFVLTFMKISKEIYVFLNKLCCKFLLSYDNKQKWTVRRARPQAETGSIRKEYRVVP